MPMIRLIAQREELKRPEPCSLVFGFGFGGSADGRNIVKHSLASADFTTWRCHGLAASRLQMELGRHGLACWHNLFLAKGGSRFCRKSTAVVVKQLSCALWPIEAKYRDGGGLCNSPELRFQACNPVRAQPHRLNNIMVPIRR